MTFSQKLNLIIPSAFIIAFLGACLFVALLSIVIERKNIFDDFDNNNDKAEIKILNGSWASKFEKSFEKNMLIRDIADGTWGALSYGVLKTGKSNVVIGKNGWLFTKEEFETISNAEKNEARFAHAIVEVNNILKTNGIELIVAIIPSKIRIYPENSGKAKLPDYRQNLYPRFLMFLKKQNIIAPNLEKAFLAQKKEGPLYLKQDTHWTPLGAKTAALTIAQYTSPSLYDSTLYDLEEMSKKDIDGDLQKYISTGFLKPWINYTNDSISHYKLKRQASTVKKSLFDDEVIPVALVGTSYSALKDWQFEDMLKYALQGDVVNMADEGKGPLEPMHDFLNETDFKNTDVKLVVWEIPERFIPVDYSDVKFSFETNGN